MFAEQNRYIIELKIFRIFLAFYTNKTSDKCVSYNLNNGWLITEMGLRHSYFTEMHLYI